jgi:hypothetical protein
MRRRRAAILPPPPQQQQKKVQQQTPSSPPPQQQKKVQQYSQLPQLRQSSQSFQKPVEQTEVSAGQILQDARRQLAQTQKQATQAQKNQVKQTQQLNQKLDQSPGITPGLVKQAQKTIQAIDDAQKSDAARRQIEQKVAHVEDILRQVRQLKQAIQATKSSQITPRVQQLQRKHILLQQELARQGHGKQVNKKIYHVKKADGQQYTTIVEVGDNAPCCVAQALAKGRRPPSTHSYPVGA